MREIKFRGLRTDGKGWVYGDLIIDGNKFFIFDKRHSNIKFHLKEDESYQKEICLFVDEVISESVGQFTGLKDKNGVEIYEGDITNYGNVVFQDGCFVIFEDTFFVSFSEVNLHFYKVIGNIYENKEIIK